MTNTKKALIISAISAFIIGLIYWFLKTLITNLDSWMVGIIVFLVSFIGMKYKDWTK